MFIIALVTGLVVISLPSPPDGTEGEARDIAVAANLAARAALFEGRTHTLAVSDDAWRVRTFADGEWRDVSGAEFAAPPTLRVEGVEVELPEDLTPFVVFEPTGQATPFALTLGRVRDYWSVVGDASADISVEPGRAR